MSLIGVQHTFRNLMRTPVLAIAAISCIAIGVAATSTVATLVSATLLRPVPFPAADRLVRIWLSEEGGNPRVSLSIPELREIESSVRSFDAFLGTARSRLVGFLDAGAQRMRGEGVTKDYFPALGLKPAVGRLLAESDFNANAPRVTVLSYPIWQQHFKGESGVVGRTFRTDSAIFTIVGVAPRGFTGTVEDDIVEFWIPLQQYIPASLIEMREGRSAWAVARLREGTVPEVAEQELRALFSGLATRYPDSYRRLKPVIEPFGENWRSRFRLSGMVLLSGAVLLLVIAVSNVAGLLFARSLDRRKEIAVRSALGASRLQVAAQFLGESLLIAGTGGAIAVWVAPFLLDAMIEKSPMRLPQYVALEPDAMSLFIALLATAIAAAAAGIVPALFATRVGPADVMRESGRGTIGSLQSRRWGNVLVGMEIALTVILLVGGGLLLRSYDALSSLDTGYRIEGVARLAISASTVDVPDAASLPAFFDRLRTELQAEPGVEALGFVASTLPPWASDYTRIRYPGLEDHLAENGISVGVHYADDGLLPMLGIPVIVGRNIESSDGPASDPIAVISESLARRMGGIGAALGSRLTVLNPSPMPSFDVRVVGVARDVAYDGAVEQSTGRYLDYGIAGDPATSRSDIYLPLARFPTRIVSIGAFTGGDAAELLGRLQKRLGQIAPTSAVHWTSTMNDEFALEFAASRFYALVVAIFAISALLLTGVGLFAAVSRTVARRTAEIGLRRALGGTTTDVSYHVAMHSFRPLVIGLAGGLSGSVALSQLLGHLLYGVAPLDLFTFGAAAVVIVAVSAIATVWPALRAIAVDPIRALRSE